MKEREKTHVETDSFFQFQPNKNEIYFFPGRKIIFRPNKKDFLFSLAGITKPNFESGMQESTDGRIGQNF